jgi:hypothetical protein
VDELDRILASEESITPSPGFAGSVMRAVRVEAEAPPAIAFPWRRALPGLLVCLVALGWAMAALFTSGAPLGGPEAVATVQAWQSLWTDGAAWPVLALVASFAAYRFFRRYALSSDWVE